MKKEFITFVTAILTISSVSFGSQNREAYCVDTNSEGYIVTIAPGGFTGATLFARVEESSLAGPRLISYVPVDRSDVGTLRTYSGPGLKLVIALESMVPTKLHPAKLKFDVDGIKGEGNLNCNVSSSRQASPAIGGGSTPFSYSADLLQTIFKSPLVWKKLSGNIQQITFIKAKNKSTEFQISTMEPLGVKDPKNDTMSWKLVPCDSLITVTNISADEFVPKLEVTHIDFSRCPSLFKKE